MDTNAPQFTPTGGIGSNYGDYTYSPSGWVTNPKKTQSVFSSKPANTQIDNMKSTLNSNSSNLKGLLADTEKGYSDYQNSLTAIQTGNLTPEEQRMLDSSRSLMQQEIENQKLTNKKYEAGVEQMGIRSGRQRYASEIQGGMQKAAIDQGIATVNDLNIKMESKLADMRQSLTEKKYDQARKAYSDYMDYTKERRQIITDINQNALAFSKAGSAAKAQKTAASMQAYDSYIKGGGKLGYEDWSIMANNGSEAVNRPVTVTEEYAKRNYLPDYLIGTSTSDIVQSFSSEEPPAWFSKAYIDQIYDEETASEIDTADEINQLWNIFRKDPNIMAATTDTTTGGSGELF